MSDPSQAQPGANTFFQEVRKGEQHWIWKFALRTTICIADIIGIGCAAWLAYDAVRVLSNPYIGYFDFAMLPGSLTAMSVSFIWCLICILVYLLRRPPSPAHPGTAVGIDLILWLALIVTGLFTIAAVIADAGFGSNPNYLADVSYASAYSGKYRLAPNGTWVYHITYVDNACYNYGHGSCHYNYTSGEYQNNHNITSVHRNCHPYFSTCAEQDAYVNMLWRGKSKREALEMVVAAVQWLGVLVHFVLFVWACVDTHRWNQSRKTEYTQEVAEKVIRDMQTKGLITVHQQQQPQPEPVMSGGAGESESNARSLPMDEIGQAR